MDKKRVDDLFTTFNLACEVFNDVEQAKKWMQLPNAYFFNETPMDVCLQGNGHSVISLLTGYQNMDRKFGNEGT